MLFYIGIDTDKDPNALLPTSVLQELLDSFDWNDIATAYESEIQKFVMHILVAYNYRITCVINGELS